MQSSHAFQLPGSDTEVLELLRDAALDVLRKFGWEGTTSRYCYTESAHVAGFFIGYFGVDPGTMSRRGMGSWDTPFDEVEDDLQHVIEIKLGEQVACFGWRGDGPIEVDHLRRGLWEFELLKASDIALPPLGGSLEPAPLAPEPMSLWVLKEPLDPLVDNERQLEAPFAITVVRHGLRGEADVAAQSSLDDIEAALATCYAATCENDEKPFKKGDALSCFCIEVRELRDRSRNEGPLDQPLFRYFIGSEDGLSWAAALLLAYDFENESWKFELRAKSWCMVAEGQDHPAATYH